MRGRLVLGTFAAASLVALLGAPPGGGATAGGVRGVVRLSHGCPGPLREGDTRRCDFAGVGILVRAFRPGASAPVGSDRTDAKGRFAIALAPGTYLLRPQVPKIDAKPVAVSVRPAAWTTVTLSYLVPPYME